MYVRENIVSRGLKSDNLPIDIDKIFMELNFRKIFMELNYRKVKWFFLQPTILLLNLRTIIFLVLALP